MWALGGVMTLLVYPAIYCGIGILILNGVTVAAAIIPVLVVQVVRLELTSDGWLRVRGTRRSGVQLQEAASLSVGPDEKSGSLMLRDKMGNELIVTPGLWAHADRLLGTIAEHIPESEVDARARTILDRGQHETPGTPSWFGVFSGAIWIGSLGAIILGFLSIGGWLPTTVLGCPSWPPMGG